MPKVRKVIVPTNTRMPIYGHVGTGISSTGVPVTPPARAIINRQQRRPVNAR